MSGTWVPLVHQPGFNAGTMLLLTDGRVMCQDSGDSVGGSPHWWALTPDATGSYVGGTWAQLHDSPTAPLYYASAVLADGRVFVAGGEYDNGVSSDLVAAAVYDPRRDVWTDIMKPAYHPPAWGAIGDAPGCLLPDGRMLIGSILDQRTALFDPTTDTWHAGPDKLDAGSEETWTLLPNGSVLAPQCTDHPGVERYVPTTNTWVADRPVPTGHDLVQSSSATSDEIGPAVLMQNGHVVCLGASGHTAVYTPGTGNAMGTWTAGPDFPQGPDHKPMRAFDAPACLLPNGHVLCVVGPDAGDGWCGPSQLVEFDGTAFAVVSRPPTADVETYECRLLLLPTGEAMLTTGSPDVRVYRPAGAPDPSWAPTVTSVATTLRPGLSYVLTGTQLNGRSQAVSYGDDAQSATNYPLVRLEYGSGAHRRVVYCKTSGHSTMGVATGSTPVHTTVTVPPRAPTGACNLVVVANGIPSAPVAAHVGPGALGPVCALHRTADDVSLYSVGDDGRTYTAWWGASSGWSGWAPVATGTLPVGAPVSAVVRTPTDIDLFAVGADGRLRTAWWSASGGWAGWAVIGTGTMPASTAVAAVVRTPTDLDLYAVGPDGRLRTAWWSAAGGWSGWAAVATGTMPPGTAVAAVSPNPGVVDVFGVGADGSLRTAGWTAAGGWTGWTALTPPGSCSATPRVSAVARTAVDVDVAAVTAAGSVTSLSWHQGSGWTAPTPAGAGAVAAQSTVSLYSRSSDELAVVGVGVDGTTRTAVRTKGTGWTPWSTLGTGPLAAGTHVEALVRTPDAVDLFAVTAGTLRTAWWASAPGWAGWATLLAP